VPVSVTSTTAVVVQDRDDGDLAVVQLVPPHRGERHRLGLAGTVGAGLGLAKPYSWRLRARIRSQVRGLSSIPSCLSPHVHTELAEVWALLELADCQRSCLTAGHVVVADVVSTLVIKCGASAS